MTACEAILTPESDPDEDCQARAKAEPQQEGDKT